MNQKKGRKANVQPPARTDAEIDKLINDNIKLAWFFVAKYEHVYPDEHERLSRALKGLWEAAVNWKDDGGPPFGTYAGKCIKWAYNRINQARFRKRRGGGVPELHLDFQFEEGRTIHEMLADPNAKMPGDQASMSEEAEKIFELVMQLPECERMIIEHRFGLGNYEAHNLGDIAAKLGVTRERVRQLEMKALARLRCMREGVGFTWDSRKQVDQLGRKAGSAMQTKGRKMNKQRWAKLQAKARAMKTR